MVWTVVWCLVEIELSNYIRHLVEVVLDFSEALFQFDAEQYQRNLCPFGVPGCAVRRG